jgi:hypothetical protein
MFSSTLLDPESDVLSFSERDQQQKIRSTLAKVRNSVWAFGIPFWIFGCIDRSISLLTSELFFMVKLLHMILASSLLVAWLYLKPEPNLSDLGISAIAAYRDQLQHEKLRDYLAMTQVRMGELQDKHMISQRYNLPFPHLCQIYHLLNLRHLETIHRFSLNNLKISNVNSQQLTDVGGMIKFETTLSSPLNVLRLWRQPIAEVDLKLHNPYTVELSIPVYDGKRMFVIFNVLPMSDFDHQFLVDIYSDLQWFKPILQLLLHLATVLTLLEDLPYLHQLTKKNLAHTVRSKRISQHESMWLFKRYADLHGIEFHSLSSVAPVPCI